MRAGDALKRRKVNSPEGNAMGTVASSGSAAVRTNSFLRHTGLSIS
jgi:hypothetical protein